MAVLWTGPWGLTMTRSPAMSSIGSSSRKTPISTSFATSSAVKRRRAAIEGAGDCMTSIVCPMARAAFLLAVLVAGCGEADPTTPPPPTLVETRPATALGLDALSVSGRVQPRGRPTRYWFELGETEAYGRRTEAAPLAPRIGAYYRESWDDGTAGWGAGVSGTLLEHVPA